MINRLGVGNIKHENRKNKKKWSHRLGLIMTNRSKIGNFPESCDQKSDFRIICNNSKDNKLETPFFLILGKMTNHEESNF